jgi:Xaa-Pro aminopeptidase
MPGDIVNVDVSGVYNRYHVNMARCFSIGAPAPEVAERCAQIYGAFDVVARTIRPGLRTAALLDEVGSYYRQHNLLDEAWWIGGYELGIAFPPDWVGEFTYSFGSDSGDATFEAGDVCNYEANFYLPRRSGLAMSINTMVFEADSAGFNQRTPNELIVVEA